ncbi:MAG: hypothetical protein HKN82_03475 [Akkermansiaceae bacterium]|nr:hypothetical protein [Akkermansiaceae bacterium]
MGLWRGKRAAGGVLLVWLACGGIAPLGAAVGFIANDVYLGNEGNSSIAHLAADGSGGSTIFQNGFGDPFTMTGMAFDSAGENLFYAREGGDGNLRRLDSSYASTLVASTRPGGGTLNVFDVARGANGHIYALTLGNTEIIDFGLDGNGPGVTVFDAGTSLGQTLGFTINSAGEFFFSNVGTNEVLKVTGFSTTTIFANGSDGLGDPFQLAVDSEDRIYVADRTAGIVRFTEAHNGTTIGNMASHGGAFAIDVDSSGNIYSTSFSSELYKFDSAGTPLGSVPFADNSDGLSSPRSLAVAPTPEPSPALLAIAAAMLAAGLRRRPAHRRACN